MLQKKTSKNNERQERKKINSESNIINLEQSKLIIQNSMPD